MSTPHCSQCGYCLVNLREPRCPECGRAFDPLDPTTYSPDEAGDRPERVLNWFMAAGLTALIAVLIVAVIAFIWMIESPSR